METFNYLLTAIEEQIATAISTLLGSIILGILIGLAFGLYLIVTARRKGWLKRSNGFWSFIAGLNYVYIPILFLVLGGFIGTVSGVHKLSGNFIDTSTQPIVEYAQGYLPQIQGFVNTQLDTRPGQNIQIEDIIAQQMTTELELEPGSYEYQAMFKINETILGTMLTLRGPESIGTLRNMDVTNMPPEVFYVLPESLHEVCDGFFFFKYLAVLGMFIPFLIIPVIEYIIFRLFGKTKKITLPSVPVKSQMPPLPAFRKLPPLPKKPKFPPLPQSDFV